MNSEDLTGLFFGSFNPIHHGHLVIASHLVQVVGLKQVWFVVSPHNPLKDKLGLANDYERLNMVNLAIENDTNIQSSDIEFGLSQPNYTINTLLLLEEKYPTRNFTLIMGSDTFNTLIKWKNYEQIIQKYPIQIFLRPNHLPDSELLKDAHPNTVVLENTPQMEISASYIRSLIKAGKEPKYLLPVEIWKYIDKWGLYL